MTGEATILVGDEPLEASPDWVLTWRDRGHRLAEVRRGDERVALIVEGGPVDWTVTIRGRRIAVRTQTARDELLSRAGGAGGVHRGPTEIRATIPGLVVQVAVQPGDEVADGDPLLTLEAMKMQNEIRAPRAGRVTAVEVAPGQAVAAGTLLVRLADLDP